MKNPFKKSSIVDTVVNVGIGGAANVGMDYLFGQVDALASLGDTAKNAIKIGVGAIGGSMVSGASAKYLRPAFDGIATVGASQLIDGLINGDPMDKGGSGNQSGSGYVPFIGRAGKKIGQRGYKSIKGTGVVPFMS